MLNRGGVKFTTPIHLQESLFSIGINNQIYVSNSLAFVLNETRSELDPFYKEYVSDMSSILYGCESEKLIKSSPLKEGRVLRYHRCCNLLIDSSLNMNEEIRKSGLFFKDYNDYKCKVVQIMERLKSNALHDNREHKYGSISTISRGYDAPSACVLAKYLDCNEVVTFSNPQDDDGEEIARILDYAKIHKIDSKIYLRNKNYLEAEGAASGEGGATFMGLENLYKGKLFIMGSRGDSLFERLHKNVNDALDFHVGNMLSQASLTPYENLLKNSSVLVALPMVGADRWSDLARISNSEEMKYWSLGNNYDRPIARRLLEDAGVKRDLFGQAKKGAGVSFSLDTLSRLKSKMSLASYKSLMEYNSSFPKRVWRDVLYKVKFYSVNFPIYANYALNRLGIRLRIPYASGKVGMLSNPHATMMLCWGVDKMKNRYNH